MKTENQNNSKLRNLFFDPSVLPEKPAILVSTFTKNTKVREINHMDKFKPFHEFQKSLIRFMPESFLDYTESVVSKAHLRRLVKYEQIS